MTISCTIALVIVCQLIPWSNLEELLTIVGLKWPESVLWSLVAPLSITAILFLGTLVVFKDTYNWPEFVEYVKSETSDLIFIRNYVVAPLTEEFIFRGILLAILGQSYSMWSSIGVSGFLFSLAHSHHYFFQRIQGSGSIRFGENLFQMLYTFVFAVYCSSLYLKTGTILTTIQIHIFCNFSGFPQLDILLSDSWYKTASITGLASFSLLYPLYLMN